MTVVADGWLYAVGDVNHRDARWGAHAATADGAAVPQVVFTDPEVASVGLTTHAAERAGRRIEVVDYDLARVAGAHQYADGYRGKARMLIDVDRGTVAGSPSPAPASGNCCTRPPSRSQVRYRWKGPGTPCPRSRRSARSG